MHLGHALLAKAPWILRSALVSVDGQVNLIVATLDDPNLTLAAAEVWAAWAAVWNAGQPLR